jgi:hypothetical protein
MIDVKELRVGNFAYNDGEIIVIDAISRSKNEIYIETNPFPIDLEDVQPIPLTSEILEACGFEKGFKDFNNQTISVDLKHKEIGLSGVDACTNGDTFWVGNTEYLHQLQNVYFFSTGQELTFQKENSIVMNK